MSNTTNINDNLVIVNLQAQKMGEAQTQNHRYLSMTNNEISNALRELDNIRELARKLNTTVFNEIVEYADDHAESINSVRYTEKAKKAFQKELDILVMNCENLHLIQNQDIINNPKYFWLAWKK